MIETVMMIFVVMILALMALLLITGYVAVGYLVVMLIDHMRSWKDWIVPIGAGLVAFACCAAEYYLGLKTGRRQIYAAIDQDLESFKQSLEPEEWEDFKDRYNSTAVRYHVVG